MYKSHGAPTVTSPIQYLLCTLRQHWISYQHNGQDATTLKFSFQSNAHVAHKMTFSLQSNAHIAPALTHLLEYIAHSALTYSTVRTVRSLTVHCAQCAHLQYSAHSGAVAPTISTVFQHILHGALALLSLFQYAKQRATTVWQSQVPATLLNFKLIVYLACLPSLNELFIKSLCTYVWVSANRQSF